MHNDRIAEWLLESVTTPERAASTVGDLREIAATRGEVWFWANVLGTTASLLWRAMVADKRRTLGLAIRAWLLSLVMGTAVTIVCIFIIFLSLGLTLENRSGWSPISLLPIINL